jgi:hypothetical protein
MTNDTGNHIGDKTHIHDQYIKPHNFNTINTTKRISRIPVLVLFIKFPIRAQDPAQMTLSLLYDATH